MKLQAMLSVLPSSNVDPRHRVGAAMADVPRATKAALIGAQLGIVAAAQRLVQRLVSALFSAGFASLMSFARQRHAGPLLVAVA